MPKLFEGARAEDRFSPLQTLTPPSTHLKSIFFSTGMFKRLALLAKKQSSMQDTVVNSIKFSSLDKILIRALVVRDLSH